MSSLPRDGRGRVRLLGLIGLLVFAALSTRLFWIQVVERDKHEAAARNQHIERVRILPPRGRILDRNGTALAYSVDNPVVIAEPKRLTDPAVRRRVAQTLSPLLSMSVSDLDARMNRQKLQTVILNQKPTPVMVDDLKALDLTGIRIEMQPKRIYPLGAAAAHVTGFVGRDQEGIEGTERAFDTELQGTPGWVTLRRDAHGGRHAFENEKPPIPGNDLTLTIDSYLQEVASNRLNEAVKKCNARGGWVLVMEPKTGDILAMANYPSYDPTFYDSSPAETYRNHIVSDRIEPGSTIKAITVSAALEEGVMRPETLINCMGGRWVLYGKPITDHEHFGTLTFLDTFVHSSNIAMAQVGMKLGPDRLYHYLKKFGFGEKTGLGLPGEEAGYLKRTEQWSGRTPATIAFGYEIQVTALQLAMAYAALANDGILMKPRLVKTIAAPDGSILTRNEPEQVRRVVTARTAAKLIEFMGKVVTDGTGKEAALDWCVVGGKTGTARKYDPKARQYVSKHYASFIGVAPLDSPRLLCYVVIDEPKGNIYGGSTAAPAFREIVEASCKSPHPIIRPSYDVVEAGPAVAGRPRVLSKLPAALAMGVSEAAAETAMASRLVRKIESDTAGRNGGAAFSAGDDDVRGRDAGDDSDTESAEGGSGAQARAMQSAPAGPKAPDLTGLSVRQALRRAGQAGVYVTITSGMGVVVRQYPAPGEPTLADRKVVLFLGDREELEKQKADKEKEKDRKNGKKR